MTTTPAQRLVDKALPEEERIRAARETADILRVDFRAFDNFQAACTVLFDADERPAVRLAALGAVEAQGPAAPNQLAAFFANDPGRVLRREAIAALKRIGVPGQLAPRLEQELALLDGPRRLLTLANLATTFGYEPRIVVAYQRAMADDDAAVRAMAVRGLCFLGETAHVLSAATDPAAVVRQQVAESLGVHGTLVDAEIRVLGSLLRDAEAAVQKAARTALRRAGIQPMAAPPARRRRVPGASSMRTLLEQLSEKLLADRDYAAQLDDAVVRAGWLGHAGAKHEDLARLESRVGTPLPASYREFLSISDGWRRMSPSIERVLPAAEVDRFAALNAEWLDILLRHAVPVTREQHLVYGPAQETVLFDASHLRTAWQVSDTGDGVYVLNPSVVTTDGEWEAWFLASWLPGAVRYPSFRALVEAECAAAGRR